MRTRTTKWFECKVRYEKLDESGTQRKVTEDYVVDALSFTEAETRITDEMAQLISGEFSITGIKIASYAEVAFSDSDKDDKFYKVKVQFITLNERTNKEHRHNQYVLIQACSTERAQKNVEEVYKGSMLDYTILSVVETAIIDVYEYKAKLVGKS